MGTLPTPVTPIQEAAGPWGGLLPWGRLGVEAELAG